MYGDSNFSTYSIALDFFDSSHSSRCEMVSHFDLYSPDDYDFEHVCVCVLISHFHIFLGEMAVQILCPFLNWVVF